MLLKRYKIEMLYSLKMGNSRKSEKKIKKTLLKYVSERWLKPPKYAP